jgi:hypothetical protein
MRRRIHVLFLLVVSFCILSGTVVCNAASTNDPQNDIIGGKVIGTNPGHEGYTLLCETSPSVPFIDIKTITWDNDGDNYWIIVEFWNPIDFMKMAHGDIYGEFQFLANGTVFESDDVDAQIYAAFEGHEDVMWWNGSINIRDVASYSDCVINTSTTIKWTWPKTPDIPDVVDKSQWDVRGFVIYDYRINEGLQTEEHFIYWDVYNFNDFALYWGNVCTFPEVPGFDVFIIGLCSVPAIFIIGRRIKRKITI